MKLTHSNYAGRWVVVAYRIENSTQTMMLAREVTGPVLSVTVDPSEALQIGSQATARQQARRMQQVLGGMWRCEASPA